MLEVIFVYEDMVIDCDF